MKAGERGYHFGFDILPSPPADRVPGKDNVVISGYEGGLEVHSAGKRGVEHVATLKGLRGGVYHAKILPWTSPGSELFPLVAVVIHGPVLPLHSPAAANEGDYDPVSNERSDALSHTNPDTPTKDDSNAKHSPGFVEAYQTSVEVYSLKTGGLVEVLLEAPKIPLKTPVTSPVFKAPPPSGAFNIKADAGSIVVSSGVTGECWLFRQILLPQETRVQFACLGKLWTTLQHPPKGDAAAEPADRGPVRAPPRQRTQSAIISLRGRWLAYCPATPSSQLALRASVRVLVSSKAPGLSSMTPPQLPPLNSELDLPVSESVMNKIMRDATQELIQGAKWVGKQGLQAWNRYWSPPASQQPRSPTIGPQGWAAAQRQEAGQFPPTHGTVTPPAPKEPGLISLLDIESLGNSPSLHPISTFTALHGCSFLSLAPSGLLLFTASSKGDVQTVWDLMRTQYTKASTIQAPTTLSPTSGPRVRQVAQFSRMTVARIVDVAWAKPNGERAAMITERGTVHLLDLPPGAFTWPPPRRRARSQDDRTVNAAEGGPSAVAMASNALSSVRDVARPLITRPRRSSSNATQLTGATFVDHASHGGKVIAASISHSLGRTGTAINQLRHTGENRVSLPASTTTLPGPSSVVWITTRKEPQLFAVGDGLIRTFPAKSRRMVSGGDPRQRTQRMTRYKDFRLPNLPDNVLAPVIKAYLDPDEYLDLERDQDQGNNTMILDNHSRQQQAETFSAESSIPQAEIESNAPYQPFHTDRRVALYECCTDAAPEGDVPALSEPLATASLEDKPLSRKKRPQQRQEPRQESVQPSESHDDVWVFGQPVKATKLDLGLPLAAEEELLSIASDESRALPASAIERVLHHAGANDDQIVVTTRRRRGAGRSMDPDEDGFFEDDCEVLDFADQRV